MAYASSQSKGDRAAAMLQRAGYASGGAVKKGKSVTVNVFAGGGAPPITPPMMGPMIPPGMPPAGMPPAGMPPMPPPGMGGPPPRAMMKKGGAVKGAARDVHKHERNMHKGKPLTKLATGGKVKGERTVSMDAGAGGGAGRLEKIQEYGKRASKVR